MANQRTRRLMRASAACAVAAACAQTHAQAQVVRDVPGGPQGRAPTDAARRIGSQWTFDLRATYSDNFRRIDDERARAISLRPRTADGGLGDPVTFPVGITGIDTPDNVVFTAGMRGGTVYQRPGLTGIVQGGLSVTINADDAPLDERLQGTPIDPDLVNNAAFVLFPDPDRDPNAPVPDFDGAVSQTFGLTEEQEVFIRPDIAASATARIVDQLFYVDVAGVAQQQLISQRDAIAVEADGQIGDVTTFVGGSVSPYLNRQVAGGGTLEARLRGSAVFVADEQFDVAEGLRDDGSPLPDAGSDDRFANDSLSAEAIVEYDSGQLFDRIGFGLRASAARSDEDGSDILDEIELTRLSASGEARYDLGRNLAVTGTLGYDDVAIEETRPGEDDDPDDPGAPGGDGIDIAGRENEFSGVFWSVGADYAPSTRSRLALSVGERFGGLQINGQLTYRPTPRLSVTGRADRDLGTGTQDGFQGAVNINSRTLQIVEQLAQVQSGTARRLLDRAVGFQGGFSNIQQQNFGVQLRDTFTLSASYTARRTDFGLGVTFTQSEFGEDDAARENERFAVQASVQRDVSRRVRAGVSGRFERLSGTLPIEVIADADAADQTSDQLFVAADASYQLGPRFSLTARAYRAQSEGAEGIVGGGIAREYTENAVSAGIRWTF